MHASIPVAPDDRSTLSSVLDLMCVKLIEDEAVLGLEERDEIVPEGRQSLFGGVEQRSRVGTRATAPRRCWRRR